MIAANRLFFFLTIFCLLAITPTTAQCIKKESIEVSWEAYKTLKKIGVRGSFDDIQVKSIATNQLSILKLSIDPKKFSTSNSTRDENISKYFFSKMKPIQVQVTKVSAKWITTSITLNGIKKKIPFRYSLKNNEVVATGNIDLLDFKLASTLAHLNKACFSMHEGKTWSHVKLDVKAQQWPCTTAFK